MMGAVCSIAELSNRIRRKEISPVEITRECLARIEQLNPGLHAFITVMVESALAGDCARGLARATAWHPDRPEGSD
jgi:Asp-tRNA(Asn)/Glu-tRNA(Gln) amidotransferase A subunit family amidase